MTALKTTKRQFLKGVCQKMENATAINADVTKYVARLTKAIWNGKFKSLRLPLSINSPEMDFSFFILVKALVMGS